MNLKIRLALMNFLEFAVWGAYLTCMGMYLSRIGLTADKWVPAQRLLGLCHLVAGLFMMAAAYYGYTAGENTQFSILFTLYSVSVAFFMPTLALTNSVAYNALTKAGMDTIKEFPPIRVFGTVGFICTMWLVDLLGFSTTYMQFVTSGAISILLFLYTFTLPACPLGAKDQKKKSLVEAFGLQAFALFKKKEMAIFFIFSSLLGVSLQITNGYAAPYIESYAAIPEYANTFGVQHVNILYSLSQISETCCILLIPFFMKRYGIKQVMLIAMFAWVVRFGFLGMGNPGMPGVILFILSMVVYGVAFDFFNISGSLYVDKTTDPSIRSSAQGLFVLMTNGIGASVGSLAAQAVVNFNTDANGVVAWDPVWSTFSVYALTVGVLFAIIFRPKKIEA